LEEEIATLSAPGLGAAVRSGWSEFRRSLPWATALGALALAAVGLTFTDREEPLAASRAVRLTMAPPPGVRFASVSFSVAITPDGQRVLFTGDADGVRRVFARDLGSLNAVPLPGADTDDGRIVLSPDGEWRLSADVAAGTLTKVPLDGASSQTLAPLPRRRDGLGFRGAAWGSRQQIVFGTEPFPGLMLVSDDGGVAVTLTSPSDGEIHGRPKFLPDGRHVLFTRRLANGNDDIAILDLDSREILGLRSGVAAEYIPSRLLLFLDKGSLWVSRFDPDAGRLIGEPIRVPEPIRVSQPNGPAHYAISANGTLVYVRDLGTQPSWTIAIVDEFGRATPLPNLPAAAYGAVRVSPNGRQLALGSGIDGISIFDLERASLTRLTRFGSFPLWSSDGTRLAFGATPPGVERGIYAVAADGTGGIEKLASSAMLALPNGWLPGGRILLSTARQGSYLVFRDQDVQIASGAQLVKAPFAEADLDESHAALSPNGHWIAYESNRSGVMEIYVERFPQSRDRLQISSGGGREPVWSRDGSRLFYMSVDGRQLFQVTVSPGVRFTAGSPRALFETRRRRPEWLIRGFDVLPGSTRFVMIIPEDRGASPPPEVVVVQNWANELASLFE
jgi:hypothetical protein